MTEQLITSDLIVSGVSGTVIGGAMGWTIKKAIKLLFRFVMVIAVFWVGSILYLSSIKVINLNENALNNLLNQTMTSSNSIINTTQGMGIENVLSSVGVPLTSGLVIGFIAGWSRG